MIDSSFATINGIFALSCKIFCSDPTRRSPVEYYMQLVEIKDFKSLIDNKAFFWAYIKQTGSMWKTSWNVKKQWK